MPRRQKISPRPTHPNFRVQGAPAAVEEHARALFRKAKAARKSPPAPAEGGWGVPDWTKKSGYPVTPAALSDLQWRWEFLRRNHGFRIDWLRDEREYRPYGKHLYFERAYQLKNLPDPRRSTLRIMADIAAGGADDNPFESSFEVAVMFEDANPGTQFAPVGEYERLGLTEAPATTVVLKLHLDRALTPQFERLGELARDAQRSWLGKVGPGHFSSRQHWGRHLRILDARDAGASYSKIAEVFVPSGRDSVPDRSAARELVKSAEGHRRRWLR